MYIWEAEESVLIEMDGVIATFDIRALGEFSVITPPGCTPFSRREGYV